MSTTYYLAGRFSRKDELAGYANQIVTAGERVNARWLTGAHDASTERELTDEELSRAFAMEDLEDIDDADAFILFTETPEAGYTSGGVWSNLGMRCCPNSSTSSDPMRTYSPGWLQSDTKRGTNSQPSEWA